MAETEQTEDPTVQEVPQSTDTPADIPENAEAAPSDQADSPFSAEGLEPQPVERVEWTASEFVAHEKSAAWYVSLALAAVAAAVVVFLITKDAVSAAVIPVAALFLGIYASHQPRQLPYAVDGSGVQIGSKHYTYDQFRSFAVLPEGAFSSVVFMPLKRFAPLTTIYFAPDDETKIVNILSERLPLEEHKLDIVDNFMRRIRF